MYSDLIHDLDENLDTVTLADVEDALAAETHEAESEGEDG